MRRISSAHLSWAVLGALMLAGAIWATHAVDTRSSPAAGSALTATTALPATALPATALPATAIPRGVSAAGVSTAGVSTATVSTGGPSLPYSVWCCSAGSPLGLTVTGQATVHGTGAAARAAAIAKAVTDATAQAKAAAGAAGISLGRIINMQVSAAYYPYPPPMGAASGGPSPVPGGPGTAGGGPAASGRGTPAIACPADSPCPGYPYASMSATVTATWAIA